MKVLIISGGNSSERKISLISANEVQKALEKNEFKTEIFDLKKGLPALKEEAENFDVIFPVLHGEEGEGGTLQKFLIKLGRPFVGGNPEGFKEGWFKTSFKKFCDKNKIPTAPWQEIREEEDIIKFGLPCVVKSSSGGSSLEVFIIKNPNDLKNEDFQKIVNSKETLFAEKLLTGIEVTAGILNNETLPIIEIVPPNGKWFDAKNKYDGTTKEIINAPSLTEMERSEVQKLALFIHQTLKLGSLSRTDFIVSEGIPYALEVNMIPGFTPNSLFPKAAEAIGLNFEQLVKKLVETVSRSY